MRIPRDRAAIPPCPVQLSKILLVEGETPSHFFDALTRDLGIGDKIEIRSFGGISQLADMLELLASTAEFQSRVTSVGIIRDAEDNPAGARAAVQGAIPASLSAQSVSVRVFILPNDERAGMLETLLLDASRDANGFHCIDSFFACADAANVSLPRGPKLAKNKLQAFLSMNQEVQMMPGIAAAKGTWRLGDAVFNQLRVFLMRL